MNGMQKILDQGPIWKSWTSYQCVLADALEDWRDASEKIKWIYDKNSFKES